MLPFELRALPEVIWLDDHPLAMFCLHCGFPFVMHSDEMLCPRYVTFIQAAILPAPGCACHHREQVKRTVMVPNPHTVRTRKDGSPWRHAVEVTELELVRNA